MTGTILFLKILKKTWESTPYIIKIKPIQKFTKKQKYILLFLLGAHVHDFKILALISTFCNKNYLNPYATELHFLGLITTRASFFELTILLQNIIFNVIDFFFLKKKKNYTWLEQKNEVTKKLTFFALKKSRTFFFQSETKFLNKVTYKRILDLRYFRYGINMLIGLTPAFLDTRFYISLIKAYLLSFLALKVELKSLLFVESTKRFFLLGYIITWKWNAILAQFNFTLHLPKKKIIIFFFRLGVFSINLTTLKFQGKGNLQLSNLRHDKILLFYSKYIKTFFSYYKNRSSVFIKTIISSLKISCLLTLAKKYKQSSVNSLAKKFRKNLVLKSSYKTKVKLYWPFF